MGHGRILRHRAGDILGNIDEDRSGPACARDPERFADRRSQIIYILYNVSMFGNGHGYTCDVDLLEGVLAEQGERHIACNSDQRNTVHISCGDTGHKIGRARAAGGQAYADFAGRAGIAVRHMRGALFMRGQIMGDLVSVFVKCIIDVEDRTSRISEDRIDSLLEQACDNDLSTCHFHIVASVSIQPVRPEFRSNLTASLPGVQGSRRGFRWSPVQHISSDSRL